MSLFLVFFIWASPRASASQRILGGVMLQAPPSFGTPRQQVGGRTPAPGRGTFRSTDAKFGSAVFVKVFFAKTSCFYQTNEIWMAEAALGIK